MHGPIVVTTDPVTRDRVGSHAAPVEFGPHMSAMDRGRSTTTDA